MIQENKSYVFKHKLPRLRQSDVKFELIFGEVISIEYLGETKEIITEIKIKRMLNYYEHKEKGAKPLTCKQKLNYKNIVAEGEI